MNNTLTEQQKDEIHHIMKLARDFEEALIDDANEQEMSAMAVHDTHHLLYNAIAKIVLERDEARRKA